MAGRRRERDRAGRRSARLTGGQKGLIAVAAVLAVALMGVAAWKSLFVRPELPDKGTGPDGSAQEIDWGEGVRPRGGGERKSKDYWTVLILGRDTGGGGNTDTMLLASYDVTNQKATVMSIPRDTMVNIPYDVKKINGVYNYGGGGEAGIQYLYKEISQLVGFEPDYQVVVEWEAVGQIVDAMDGVWFDVPRNMNYDDPLQNLHIHQEKGYRLLSGEDAMEVLRYRRDNDKHYGYPEGDVGRIKTQQAFLSAMVEQLLKVENVPKIRQFIQVFQDNVETDLTFQNILLVCPVGISGRTAHRGCGVCHHAPSQRRCLEPQLPQLSVLCGAHRRRAAGPGEHQAQSLYRGVHSRRSGHHVRCLRWVCPIHQRPCGGRKGDPSAGEALRPSEHISRGAGRGDTAGGERSACGAGAGWRGRCIRSCGGDGAGGGRRQPGGRAARRRRDCRAGSAACCRGDA